MPCLRKSAVVTAVILSLLSKNCEAFTLSGAKLGATRTAFKVARPTTTLSSSPDPTGDYLSNLGGTGGSSEQSYLDSVDQKGGVLETPTEDYLKALNSPQEKSGASSYLTDLETSAPPTQSSGGGSGAVPPTDTDDSVSDSTASDRDTAELSEEPRDDPAAAQQMKDKLLRACLGTNRGFTCRREERRAISAMIKELELLNPNRSPNDGFDTGDSPLTGDWQLLFTDALDVLSLSLLPGISIGQIYQNIGTDGTEISNIVELQPILAPLLPSTLAKLTVKAKGSVASDVRLDLTFEAAAFAPQTLLGREVAKKLKPLKLMFPKKLRNVGWLDHTYVDEDIRIARALGGSAFVLLKVKDAASQ